MSQIPSIGRIVQYNPLPNETQNDDFAPRVGIIVAVWGGDCVNVAVFPRYPDDKAGQIKTSINQVDALNKQGRWFWPPYVGPTGSVTGHC